ncbi:MAG: RNA polymerase sigma factor [Bacteroidota bacterium]
MRAFVRNYTGNSALDEQKLLFIISLTLMLPHQIEDTEIIQRIINKDKDALYLLYDKYSGALFGVILRICQNQELAEDVLQETFLKIWEKIHSYNPNKGKFYTWAYRIAKNRALNSLRKSDKLIQNDDLSVIKDKSEAEDSYDLQTLNGALSKLEPHHQQAISLVYFRGYTHREANEEMGVPLGTFKSYIRQAIQLLRESYKIGMVFVLWLMEVIS